MGIKIDNTIQSAKAIRTNDIFYTKLEDLNIDGSTTITFMLDNLPTNTKIVINRINFAISTDEKVDSGKFGSSAITNGVLMELDSNTQINFVNNADIQLLVGEMQISTIVKGNNFNTIVSGCFDLLATYGNGIITNSNDFKIIVRDDLTDTNAFSISVSGIIL